MRKTHLRRSLAAVFTALACLAVMANPAAATTHSADLTGGVITLTKTGVTEEINLDPTVESCDIGETTFVVDTTSTTPHTIIITVITSSHVVHFTTTSASYLVILTRSNVGNVSGTINSTGSPHTVSSMRVGIKATVYNTTSCTPTGTPICELGAVLHLGGSSTSLTTSSTFTLTGSSVGNVVAFPTCTAGPSHLLGTSSTVTSAITGHIL